MDFWRRICCVLKIDHWDEKIDVSKMEVRNFQEGVWDNKNEWSLRSEETIEAVEY